MLLPPSDLHKIPDKIRLLVTATQSVIREMLFERKALIDILTLKPDRLKIRGEEPIQVLYFNRTVTACVVLNIMLVFIAIFVKKRELLRAYILQCEIKKGIYYENIIDM